MQDFIPVKDGGGGQKIEVFFLGGGGGGEGDNPSWCDAHQHTNSKSCKLRGGKCLSLPPS